LFRRRRPAAERLKMIVVSHTHWDREWYLPFQRFRALLVETVDSLLTLMADRPEYRYFTLDGQTIVLEDYLEVRPEREKELHRLISHGRILIGPWYVMPDEFLVSGESLVRNLLEGRRTGARFGPVMSVGYIPDPFGHVAQMPQILTGFGIDSAVLWRGVGRSLQHTEAYWEAPDGSRVLLEQLYGSYSNAALLPSSTDALMERLAHIRAQLEPRATTRHILLMNGDDHMAPQPDIPDLIAEANRRLRDAELIHGNLPMMIKAVEETGPPEETGWGTLRGELRSSELAHLLAGVLSTRIGLKQRNSRCQTLLERWAEPFSSYASLLLQSTSVGIGQPRPALGDPVGLLRLAWRYLLKNQPHDSICGCSVDQVHREMETRYDWCEQIGDQVAGRALEALTGSVDTESTLRRSSSQGAIVVFNSEAGPRTDFVTATVELPEEPEEVALTDSDGGHVPFQLLREQHTELASTTLSRSELQGYLRLAGPGRDWPRWKLRLLEKVVKAALRNRVPDLALAKMDVTPGSDPSTVEIDVEAAAGKEHDYDAVSAGMKQLTNLVDRGNAQYFRLRVRRRDQVEIGFVAPDVPSHGLRLFHFQTLRPASSRPLHQREEGVLENEFLSLQVSRDDGSLRILDRESGAILWGINTLVDGGDAGDEYSHSPPIQDLLVQGPSTRPVISLEEAGPARQALRIEYAMSLPEGLTEDRRARSGNTVDCPVSIWVCLYPEVARVDIRTTVTNLAKDHRLRVHFPTQLDTQTSHADGHFAVITRPIQLPAPVDGYVEHPVTTNPQLAFVDVNDGTSGLMIANRGLPEFDVAPLGKGPCIALTLLRCVGWLSRDDLSTRQGAAGPALPTPGAQMLGTHTFEYSVIPHSGGWEDSLQKAYWFASPLQARWTERHPGPLAPSVSFVALEPSTLVLSAVKRAEEGGRDLVVRLYNLLDRKSEARLRTYFPMESAWLSNLIEEAVEELTLQDRYSLTFEVAAHKIVTLRLTPAMG